MASDIGLVLGSEHRDLLVLADQSGWASRGFHDPVTELGRRLLAHVAAVEAEVHPVLRSSPSLNQVDVRNVVERVDAILGEDAVDREALAGAARDLVDVERAVLPALVAMLPIAERRRMGKVFRIRRDAALRSAHSRQHRQLSQTELYELARRAGLEHRSTMTQAQRRRRRVGAPPRPPHAGHRIGTPAATTPGSPGWHLRGRVPGLSHWWSPALPCYSQPASSSVAHPMQTETELLLPQVWTA